MFEYKGMKTFEVTDYTNSRPLAKSGYQKINFLISQQKHMLWVLKRTYVVGTQKNRLNETALLSTQNIC